MIALWLHDHAPAFCGRIAASVARPHVLPEIRFLRQDREQKSRTYAGLIGSPLRDLHCLPEVYFFYDAQQIVDAAPDGCGDLLGLLQRFLVGCFLALGPAQEAVLILNRLRELRFLQTDYVKKIFLLLLLALELVFGVLQRLRLCLKY